ncbi:MAG TPA: 4Fe-4S dicluster domain-containing protein [Candidatus Limnocylindrales bacterium]
MTSATQPRADGAARSARPDQPDARFLARADLGALIDALRAEGRRVIGPVRRDGAIVLGEVAAADDLPAGWGAEAAPGRYRLIRRGDERVFEHNAGPTSWKAWTFPASAPLTRVAAAEGETTYEPAGTDIRPLAFLGVRACEVAAILVQDRVLLGGPYVDEDYQARRGSAFIVAVQCTSAASTCFCASMGTGPEVGPGADLVMTELDDGFVVERASAAGRRLLDRLPTRPATEEAIADAMTAVGGARATMAGQPGVQIVGLKDRLLARLDDPRWALVAERCLACANCTSVCPTCFCTSVLQRSELVGTASGSTRTWDSCFNPGFARVAGGNFRSRTRDRYRQWLTHKFATWVDQFGTFGCVGCGRCIAWCPVGIDVREELLAIAPPIAPSVLRPSPAPIAPTPQEFGTARVTATRHETRDVVTLVLGDLEPALLMTKPGQFVMLTLPAFPRLPISVSRTRSDGIELTIRSVGPATDALTRLKPGELVGIRGPLGTGWPIDAAVGRDVVVVTGGIGLAPLRPLVDAVLADRSRFGAFRIYYGARTPGDMLYRDELASWMASADVDLHLSVDRADESWLGPVGVVTHLFDKASWDGSKSSAFVCGPERMMQATATALFDRGFHGDRVYVTLERHMECGIGLCGHCQMGRYFVCKDGPVFTLAQLGDIFGREGI